MIRLLYKKIRGLKLLARTVTHPVRRLVRFIAKLETPTQNFTMGALQSEETERERERKRKRGRE